MIPTMATNPHEHDPDNSLTPEQLETLHSYREAFKSEWEVANNATTKEQKKDKLDEQLAELVPDALAALKHDIKFATTPAIRQKAYTFVLNAVREDASKGNGASDPIKKFLEGMEQAANATPDPESRNSSET
jgi:hypothetical protein